jgi:hypothetical protein
VSHAGGIMLSDILVWGLIICFAVMLVFGIVGDWFPHNGGNVASFTAFHDFQPKDKQQAIEVVMDQRAGKKQFEQTNGDELFFDGFEIRTESELSEKKNELQ